MPRAPPRWKACPDGSRLLQLPIKRQALQHVVELLLRRCPSVFQSSALGAERADAVLLLLELADVAQPQVRFLRGLAEPLQVLPDALLVAVDVVVVLLLGSDLLVQVVNLVFLGDDAAERLLNLRVNRLLLHPER